MLTHVHKVIHLVVAHLIKGGEVWEQGQETPPAECPPVERGQSDGATGALDRKDEGHWE